MMMRREKNMMLLLLLQKNNSYYYNHCIKTVYILLIDKECIYIVPTKITTSCYLFFLSFCFFLTQIAQKIIGKVRFLKRSSLVKLHRLKNFQSKIKGHRIAKKSSWAPFSL